MKSVRYEGDAIEDFFSTHRIKWDDFYDSERDTIEQCWPTNPPQVLDIGAACGGLGLALVERFGPLGGYTGIEFNRQAAATARRLHTSSQIIEGDFLEVRSSELRQGGYDLVFSLSCIDWQANTVALLERAWGLVADQGLLILSLRLTLDESRTQLEDSFQFINYDGDLSGERAPYVVLNAGFVRSLLEALGAKGIRGNGYWGVPSVTAVTPFDRVCFAVLAVAKSANRLSNVRELSLPDEVAQALLHDSVA